MVTSEELDMTFRKVGSDFGFENVDTEFSAYRDQNRNSRNVATSSENFKLGIG